VHFPSATTPPTPLQQRLAQERGTAIVPQPTTELVATASPAGAGPFPAIVALHGCGGRGPREYEDALADAFTALGYVLLVVDSFGPRGIANRCFDAASDETSTG
jgi:dienelactone hydrolase